MRNQGDTVGQPQWRGAKPSQVGAGQGSSHSFGLQEDFEGVAQDHATMGVQTSLHFQLIEVAIKPLDEGDRETDIHDA